ncbi:MAG TPA: nucleotidyltransferase domain-containing protein [Cyclobacteriaceae bacterium]|nr:nucleotidyltransferase domain-containing protein [Cyclobacteriaceae bacterium]
MTLQELNQNNKHLLLKCISGSQAYGLALPHSDTDIKGVFVLPKNEFYGLEYTDQVNNDTNDEMFYEIKKFIDLLLKNNPNIIELLNTPDDCVLIKHPVMQSVKPEMFLSRLCNQTFGQYAYAQIKKARGLNKKILNPLDKQRKTILDFCYVVEGQGSILITQWLNEHRFSHEECGLIRIDHMRDMYALFHSSQVRESRFNGIFSGETADDVLVSSIPKGTSSLAVMSFNKDGYSIYCKEYKQYWEWVNTRNEARYDNTISHGKNYDSKNMMHVFRLLNMAEEIARYKEVNVRRSERDYLLKIRAGEFQYQDLVDQAEEKIQVIDELFKKSDLPEAPDKIWADKLLIETRERFYNFS